MSQENSSLPKLFNYKEERSDTGYEAMQDFFLSWTLRCAEEKYAKGNKKLHHYSKNTLLGLIFGKSVWDKTNSNFYYTFGEIYDCQVLEVKSLRQWNRNDLLLKIEIERNGNRKKYVLNIENKWYTKIRMGQLETYSQQVINEYKKGFEIINLVIFCDYVKLNSEIFEFCESHKYKILAVEDIYRESSMQDNGRTNNYLFDEYWVRF